MILEMSVRMCLTHRINLIFAYYILGIVSVRGSAISSAKEGKSDFIYNLVKS